MFAKDAIARNPTKPAYPFLTISLDEFAAYSAGGWLPDVTGERKKPRRRRMTTGAAARWLSGACWVFLALYCMVFFLGEKTIAQQHVNFGSLRPIDRSRVVTVLVQAPWSEEPLRPALRPLDAEDVEAFLDKVDYMYWEDPHWITPVDALWSAPQGGGPVEFGVIFSDSSCLYLAFVGWRLGFGAVGHEGWTLDYIDDQGHEVYVCSPMDDFYDEMVEKYYPDYVPPMYPY